MKFLDWVTKFLILIIFTFSCRATKVYSPALADLQVQSVTQVSLKELLLNKHKYQGQCIETEGRLIFNWENFSLHYFDEFSFGDTTLKSENLSGLGIELHPDIKLAFSYLDSLNDKIIKVRGVFDTMNYIKISGLSEQGLLKNVFYFQNMDE